jgi:uncharacterized membrane protein YkvA (DUF1232 family)
MLLIISVVLAVVAGVLAVFGAASLAWKRASPEERALVKRIARLPLRRKLALAVGLARDRRIPLGLRGLPVLTVLYLAMPVDIVPDFIPVLGQLDDVLLVIVAVAVLFRFTPHTVLELHVSAQEGGGAGQ